MNYLVDVLYIVAFGLFILGLSGLTGPKTAVRGNWIAAAGMGIRRPLAGRGEGAMADESIIPAEEAADVIADASSMLSSQ